MSQCMTESLKRRLWHNNRNGRANRFRLVTEQLLHTLLPPPLPHTPLLHHSLHTPPLCKLEPVPPPHSFSNGVQPKEDEADQDQEHWGHRQHQLQCQTNRPQLQTHLLIVFSQSGGKATCTEGLLEITGDY